MIKLYQFAFSHFCEKARWALDYKNIPYTPVNLLPGLHIKSIQKLKRRAPVLEHSLQTSWGDVRLRHIR